MKPLHSLRLFPFFLLLSFLAINQSFGATNIAPLSSASCSSETAADDQTCVKAIDEIIDGWPGDYTKEWASDGEREGAWIELNWSESHTIDRIVLFDRPNNGDQVFSGTLQFSDLTTVSVGNLPNDGSPFEVVISPEKTITWIRFTVDSVSSTSGNIGLAEINVIENSGTSNSPPVANDDSANTDENTPVTINVLSNDTDPDPTDFLSVDSVTQGTNGGSVEINLDDTTVTYTPDPGFVGTDTFTYIAKDNKGATSNSATVTVGVNSPINIAPLSSTSCSSETVADGQTCIKAIDEVIDGWPGDYTKEWASDGEREGAWIELNWSESHTIDRIVLYDRPNNGDQVFSGTLQFSDLTTVSVGNLPNDGSPFEVVISPEKTITWIRFTVDSVSSISGNIGLAEINVIENSGTSNSPPVANDDSANTDEDTPVTIDVLSNDTDPDPTDILSVDSVTQGTNGSVDNLDDKVTYTPDPGFVGTDTFTYIAKDNKGATSNSATVTVNVSSSDNSPPLAKTERTSTAQNTSVTINVLSNDFDPDPGDVLSVDSVTQGTNGSVEINLDDTVTYTPNSGFSGTDTFAYVAKDSNGVTSNEATVIVAVGNSPPLSSDDNASTYKGTAVTLDALSNDIDPNIGDTLSITWVTQGANGSVSINTNNTITYLPDPMFVGGDIFVYTVDDGSGGEDTGTVLITVVDNATNNIALLSSASCSSETVADGQTCIKAIDEVIDGWPGDYTKEWASDGEREGAWIELNWSESHTIDRIVLYDRPNNGDQVFSGTLQFSDFTTVSVGNLPNDGSPFEVVISPKKTITWVRFTVDSVSSTSGNIGLAEIEVYGLSLNPFGHYVAVGDSITRGSQDDFPDDDTSQDGRNSGGGYEPILNDLLTNQKDYAHTVINEGVSGDDSSDGLFLLPSILSKHPEADYFLVQYGTNDPNIPRPSGLGLQVGDSGYSGSFKDNMQQMINLIINAGKIPHLGKVPKVFGVYDYQNEYLQEYNQVIEELVIENNINVVPPDFYCFFEANPDQISADDFHPNGIGYQSMATIWFNTLMGQYQGCVP